MKQNADFQEGISQAYLEYCHTSAQPKIFDH